MGSLISVELKQIKRNPYGAFCESSDIWNSYSGLLNLLIPAYIPIYLCSLDFFLEDFFNINYRKCAFHAYSLI